MKKIWALFILTIFSIHLGWALDKSQLETNIRKYLNLTSKQKISIGDPTPSDFAGLQKIMVSIEAGQYPIYLAPDGVKYFWGQIFDLSKDPDKDRMSKISLTKVHAHGSVSAPVTVVEFTDLQCPYCSKAHKNIKDSLYKDYKPEQVRMVFKHFPLSMHEWAERAAVASECAAAQNEEYFWDITDKYYEKQNEIKGTNFSAKTDELVTALKMNASAFAQCTADEKIKAKVNADRAEGNAVGVAGTPTFFVNGRMLRGTAYEDLKNLINEKLEEKK